MEYCEILQRLPLDELRRRAEIVEILHGITPARAGSGLYTWHDGGGQATAWQFTSDGRALLLTYEHESPLNLINEEPGVQQSLYEGVPIDLVESIQQQASVTDFSLFDDDPAHPVIIAGGVFWFDGQIWRTAEGLLKYCADTDIDIWESGFSYCTYPYLLDKEIHARNCSRGQDHTRRVAHRPHRSGSRRHASRDHRRVRSARKLALSRPRPRRRCAGARRASRGSRGGRPRGGRHRRP